MLVDDESLVVDVGKTMLEKLGHDVITAQSGDDAIQIFSSASKRIDLIILDMIMPGLDGSKAFDRLRMIHPSIPVLLSSGYSLNSQANQIMLKGCNAFIQKPFSIAQLSERIRQIIPQADPLG